MRPFRLAFSLLRAAAAGAGRIAERADGQPAGLIAGLIDGRAAGRLGAAACCLLCLALALAGWLAVRPEPLLAATSGSIGKAGPVRPAPDRTDRADDADGGKGGRQRQEARGKAAPVGQLTTEEDIRKALQAQQSRLRARQESITRLSVQERALNTDLAMAEDRITALEAKVARQEQELVQLEAAATDVRAAYERLAAERSRTEASLSGLLQLLWPLYMRQKGVGARDLTDWRMAERDYAWTQELYKVIGERQQELHGQETAMADALTRREALSEQVRKQVEALGADRSKLLADKQRFRQSLSSVRQQREDAEAELADLFEMIQTLNARLEQALSRGDIEKQKGRLPWPAKGRVVRRYAPGAKPPVRGLGISVGQGEPVRAVAYGRVVHNDTMRGFGRVVILMHGQAYYTLYAFLADSPLRLGQEVGGGQQVGAAGFYPDANGPGVYFELRFHQKAINPDAWLLSAN